MSAFKTHLSHISFLVVQGGESGNGPGGIGDTALPDPNPVGLRERWFPLPVPAVVAAFAGVAAGRRLDLGIMEENMAINSRNKFFLDF